MAEFLYTITILNGSVQALGLKPILAADLPANVVYSPISPGDLPPNIAFTDQANVFTVGPQTITPASDADDILVFGLTNPTTISARTPVSVGSITPILTNSGGGLVIALDPDTIETNRYLNLAFNGVHLYGLNTNFIENTFGLSTDGTWYYGFGCNNPGYSDSLFPLGSGPAFYVYDYSMGQYVWVVVSTGHTQIYLPNAAPMDTYVHKQHVMYYVDEAANKLKFRYRYSGGTYRTADLPLGNSFAEAVTAMSMALTGL